MNNVKIGFNKWHESRPVDKTLDTSWHDYFAAKASEFITPNSRILEIGCGRGGFAVNLAKLFSNVYSEFYASDFSESAVEIAKDYAQESRVEKYIKFQVNDIENLNYDSNSFDRIICFETIEHVPNPVEAIKELYRVLKPGGQLILTTPNYLNFYGLYRVYMRFTGRRWSEVGQPINQFVVIPRTCIWLKRTGFKILDWGSEEFSVPLPSKKIYHFNFKRPPRILMLFGLQSFFHARK